MPGKNGLHNEWLQKAEEDEFAGREILDAKRFPAPACFHFQQMVEKMLKALLVYRKQEFPKVHDVIALASRLEPFYSDIKSLRDDLAILNRYYVETRYPGDYPEISLTESREAYQAALRIKEFVLEKISEKVI